MPPVAFVRVSPPTCATVPGLVPACSHLNAPRLRFFYLGQHQGNHSIAHLGIDVVLIDLPRNPKASPKRTDIVFTVDWLQAFVLAEVDRAFHSEPHRFRR